MHSFLFSFEMKKKLLKLQGISLHTKKYHNLPPPSKKNLYQLNMNELPLWQLAKFIWPIQEETDTKNATLCVREKNKDGKGWIQLSITVLNKILKLFVCINTILHQTFNPLRGPSYCSEAYIYLESTIHQDAFTL